MRVTDEQAREVAASKLKHLSMVSQCDLAADLLDARAALDATGKCKDCGHRHHAKNECGVCCGGSELNYDSHPCTCPDCLDATGKGALIDREQKEREAFETWCCALDTTRSEDDYPEAEDQQYVDGTTQVAWLSWQARAALANGGA